MQVSQFGIDGSMLRGAFQIEQQVIGPAHPTYVIAEIGINHNGDEGQAMTLIDAAKAAGVDAVKFQKRHLPSLYAPEVLTHPERFEQNFQYMIPLLKEVELGADSLRRLKSYCEAQEITFLCTPFDQTSLNLLAELNVAAYKISSADLTNMDLISAASQTGKPIILSTGMANWSEIEQTVDFLHHQGTAFALLHCRSVYPVWPREVNLRMLNRLQEFNCPVGYSGHEVGIVVALVAASMGAAIIEKHITLDRNQPGPDHKASLEPHEFKRLVRDIRIADQALGKKKRFLLRGEVLNRELFAKSLVAANDLHQGQTITAADINVLGPGKGLSPQKKNLLIGQTAIRDLEAGDFFLDQDLLNATVTKKNSFSFQSKWGLIARFTDAQSLLAYHPKVLEFHLAEKDFNIPHGLSGQYPCQLVVHGPEYMGDKLHDLCSLDEKIRQDSVQLVIKTMALTREISPFFQGRPKVITHPGAMTLNTKLAAPNLALALSRSLAEIKAAGYDDMELLLENLPPYPWYFGGQWKGNYFMAAQEILSFCQQHQQMICFDLSHAALHCNAKEESLAQYIKTVLPVTHHIHFADGYGLDGEGVPFGEGDIDLPAILPLFRDYQDTWVPEIWRGHLNNGQGFLEALAFLNHYFP